MKNTNVNSGLKPIFREIFSFKRFLKIKRLMTEAEISLPEKGFLYAGINYSHDIIIHICFEYFYHHLKKKSIYFFKRGSNETKFRYIYGLKPPRPKGRGFF